MTAVDVPVAPPGRRAWWLLVLAEARMVVRDTAGLIVPVGMPVLIMVMFGMGAADEVLPDRGGMTVFDVFVMPLALMMVLSLIGVVNMPSFIATYRKTGVLKRLGVTPVHPAMVLVAQVVVSLTQAVIGIGIAVAVAVTAFDLSVPGSPGVVLGVVVLATAAFYALGLLVAAVAPSPNAAVALGLLAFFALGATGGMFGSMESLPDVMARIGEVTPFGAAVTAVQAGWVGEAVDRVQLLALGGWAAGSALVAAVTFRWE